MYEGTRWRQAAEDVKGLQTRERILEERAGRVYASLDGVHVPLHGEWRELKTLCWYEVERIRPSRSQNHHGVRVGEQSNLQAKETKYYCDIQEAEQFGHLLWATGIQNQVDAYDEIVFVIDGAVWIWRLVEKYFPKAVHLCLRQGAGKSWTGTMPANISRQSLKPPLEPTLRKHTNG